MPFTPLHLGPGAAFKALGRDHFSFMVFGGTQVLMDVEPLIRIIRGDAVLHGPSHTLAGAAVIAVVAGWIGRPISMLALGWLNFRRTPFPWHASFCGALVGALSHLILDGLMHADMRPFWPVVSANPLLSAVTVDRLHGICLALAAIGILGLAIPRLRGRD